MDSSLCSSLDVLKQYLEMKAVNTVIGTIASRIQGFAAVGRRTDVNITKISWMDFKNVSGSSSSMQPTSLENLFMIRPTGFESKKKTGACRIATTILSWSRSEHLNNARQTPHARTMRSMKDAPTSEPKMIRFFLFRRSSKRIVVKNDSQTSQETKIAKQKTGEEQHKKPLNKLILIT